LITLAKKGNETGEAKAVHARRLAAARLNDPEIVMKLFDDIAPRYVDRPGGYTRMIKLGQRLGDAAEMVILELVEE
jgi:large subunit ribosomal protein L17